MFNAGRGKVKCHVMSHFPQRRKGVRFRHARQQDRRYDGDQWCIIYTDALTNRNQYPLYRKLAQFGRIGYQWRNIALYISTTRSNNITTFFQSTIVRYIHRFPRRVIFGMCG